MRCKRSGFDPWVGTIPWRRKWQPTPVFLPGKFHGQRNLAGYSSWDCTELDMTEQLSTFKSVFSVANIKQNLAKLRFLPVDLILDSWQPSLELHKHKFCSSFFLNQKYNNDSKIITMFIFTEFKWGHSNFAKSIFFIHGSYLPLRNNPPNPKCFSVVIFIKTFRLTLGLFYFH